MFSLSVRIGGSLELRDILIARLVQCIVEMDVAALTLDPTIPCLYDARSATGARIYYDTTACDETQCTDLEWESPEQIIARGFGDCKSLVAWRIAWLRVRKGILTEPLIDRTVLDTGDVMYHVRLRGRMGGRIVTEDPSEILKRSGSAVAGLY